ncbi:MAG: SRPBCC domain-containing protein [Spirochaetales bacterium]|nr:SRPBCC domain-containing protein [Spirochaetales bacterium]
MKRSATMNEIEDIVITQTIRSPMVEVFRAITTGRIIDEWGGGPARVQARSGGKISLWDGEMHGTIKEYDFPRRLVFTLREISWDEHAHDSLVSWEFRETDRGTLITLLHSGLPTRKIREQHSDGWGEYFLGPMKAYLEYFTDTKQKMKSSY